MKTTKDRISLFITKHWEKLTYLPLSTPFIKKIWRINVKCKITGKSLFLKHMQTSLKSLSFNDIGIWSIYFNLALNIRYKWRGRLWHFLKPYLQEFNLKKSYSTEIWNDSRFKEVQSGTVKISWWNSRYRRFPPKKTIRR